MIRLTLMLLQYQAKMQGNMIGDIAAKVCQCCVTCLQRCLEFVNKNAYFEIAISSTTFCTSAHRALQLVMQYMPAIAMLNGATWIFMFGGMGVITSVCSFLTWLTVSNVSWFDDETSDHFVEDKIFVTVVAGIIAFLIAVVFMSLFDTVSDCILYCFAVDQQRGPKGNFAPEGLRHLIHRFSGDDY
eukprot:gnl/TRDRNA2_/TRDRNA2_135355_c0_seq2.p1 gnl/TRDRNA2_/TRDRNA2_135355_c0~~gnl/TRDRNA2_/TRDRNA2_135355_c0_seq2.p1  ORF type:complete len:186 (+),score=35.31 gnl/TRDRNA2_/TRDRNA2_135355_c0_seq2:141-698(+)